MKDLNAKVGVGIIAMSLPLSLRSFPYGQDDKHWRLPEMAEDGGAVDMKN